MKLLFLLLLLLGNLATYCQDSTAKIDERFLHAVLNIENHNRNSAVFEYGTGFLVSVDVGDHMYIYLVTNKHVISNNYTVTCRYYS
jgi:hypothetical protein